MTNDAVVEEVIEEPTEAIEAEAIEPKDEPKDQPDPSPDEEKDAIQKRIDKATRKQRNAERDRDYWRDQAQKKEEEPAPPPKPDPIEVKTLEDFEYDEGKYQSYIFEQAAKHATTAAKSALEEDKTKADANIRQKAFQSKEDEYSKTVEDYMEVTRDNSLSLTKEMVDIASSATDGPALLYYLAKNPDISAMIARLTPMDAAREMGRIEATKLSVESKKQTDAPKPAPKIDGVNAGVKKKEDDMSIDEWRAMRRKQRDKKRNK